jgi:hemoglobin/transferrin/lactoferrin receptor protein
MSFWHGVVIIYIYMKNLIIITISIFYALNIFAQNELKDTLSEVSVSAIRLGNKSEIQTVTIDKKSISFSNPQSAAHLLENTGAVLVQRSQGGGGSPIIRGFEANKVLLVVDGVRMNNAIYRGGHLQNVITLDPNMLQSADILFGANALKYGSDALGGVMYFQTQKPKLYQDDKFHVQVGGLLRYSSVNQEKSANLKFNIGIKKFASLTNFSYSGFGDLRTGAKRDSRYGDWGKRTFYVGRINDKDSIVKNANPNLQIGTAYKQYDFLQKFLFAQNQYTTHQLNLQLSNSSDIPRYDRLTEANAKGVPAQAEWYYGPQKRTMLSYYFESTKQSAFSDKVQLIAAYQNIEESRNSRSFGKDNRTERAETVKVLSLNADFLKTFGKSDFQYGIELTHNNVVSVAQAVNVKTGVIIAASTRYPDGGSQMLTAAAYGTNTYNISEKSKFILGARYNFTQLNATFRDKAFFPFPFNDMKQQYNALVGNIAFQQKTNVGFSATASLSSAYRVPNVDDLTKVFESVAGRLIVPNTDLKPEKTYNAELILTQNLGQKGAIQVVPFFTRYYNVLSLAAAQFEGKDTILYAGKKSAIFKTVNLDKANIFGISLSGRYKIFTNITLSGYYTYTKGRVLGANGDGPLDHIPPTFGKISIAYRNEKLQASFYTLFNGAKKTSDYRLATEDNELYSADVKLGFMPSWYTLNLRASYDIRNNLTVQLGLENILDQHYRVFASGMSAAGRNLSVTLRSNF